MKLSSLLFLFSLASLTSLAHGGPSPFDLALQALQDKIEYKFVNIDLLHRALTHSSYSRANNRVLSVFGSNLLATFASLNCLDNDIDVSPLNLSRAIANATDVRRCAAAGLSLGLDMVIRVVATAEISPKSPSIVCGAFRAVLGAVALDSGKLDRAAEVFSTLSSKRSEFLTA
ncbi:hypothetical protein Scep_017743 [Stephania cephalantha]|uniref:RNase III domain-containing protein n=1 Tax=Stephania cephalantha TaxID=152367 RepID=A0AAP0NVY1_9MAGN